LELVDDEESERSAIFAKGRTNRERGLLGSNSDSEEVGFNPIGLEFDLQQGISSRLGQVGPGREPGRYGASYRACHDGRDKFLVQ
jgi:hypothetical protein